MWAAVRAYRDDRPAPFAWLGFLLGVTALSRPAFVLFAPALAGIGLIVLPALRVRPRPAISRWCVMLSVFLVTMLDTGQWQLAVPRPSAAAASARRLCLRAAAGSDLRL